MEIDLKAFDSLVKKIRSKGFNRLTPEQKQAIAEAEPQAIKKTEWREHVHLVKDNFEIVKILEILYGLLCNLEFLLIPIFYFSDLITIKNK